VRAIARGVIKLLHQLYIHGKWVSGTRGLTKPVTNPANEQIVAEVAQAQAEDVEAAVNSANLGFKIWRSVSPWERSKILNRVAYLIEVPADVINGVKKFVIDKVMESGGKVCPPTIVGVGIGGTSDLCTKIAKLAASRPLGSVCDDPEGAKLEKELSEAINSLGIGAQGLGGNSTAFAVHVETAATHITMNPVAVNIMCNSARRAQARFTTNGVEYGF